MSKSITRRINILRDSVARRIAAGEVIDRPQAVVRELLDNSIDAGSTDVSLYIRGGGIDEIRVVDNGAGMDAENLEKCFLPHATSKITDFEDIYSIRTLGFRGEALSSIAACSKLTIVSSTDSDEPANKLEIVDGGLRDLSEYRGSRGTVVSVRDLFYSMPGRRNFLKSASAESGQCRSMFIEKSLPQTDISFRYFVDDNLRIFLPASDRRQRVISAYGSLFQHSFLKSFEAESDEIKVSAVLGTPSLYRRDRKYIQVFINNRRISDYSLVQAADYAYSNYLPGGCHPVCFLFLDIPPAHVDFNIHPAKREVKFRNLPTIHHTVTEEIGKFLSRSNSFGAETDQFSLKKSPSQASSQSSFDFKPHAARTSHSAPAAPAAPGAAAASEAQSAATASSASSPADSIFRRRDLSGIAAELKPGFESTSDATSDASLGAESALDTHSTDALLYLGQLFNLFLIFEQGDKMILIDQHAAHERIIFNKLSSSRPEVQELLVPMEIFLERDEEKSLEPVLEDCRILGFDLQQAAPGRWLINAMPSICTGMEDQLSSFFRSRYSDADELKKELYAMASCRAAIKDGDVIDDISAVEIAGKVLEMENPRCPHGRPIIQIFSREQLFKMFGRTF